MKTYTLKPGEFHAPATEWVQEGTPDNSSFEEEVEMFKKSFEDDRVVMRDGKPLTFHCSRPWKGGRQVQFAVVDYEHRTITKTETFVVGGNSQVVEVVQWRES